MTILGKYSVKAGAQTTIAMGYSATPVKVRNLDNGNDATILFAWVYNDTTLIASPQVASPPDVKLDADGARTIMPEQKTDSHGQFHSPRTFVIYNNGPGEISVEKLG